MKVFMFVLFGFMLTGCDTIYKKPEFPKPPPELMQPAPELKVL